MRKIDSDYENPIDNVLIDSGLKTLPFFKSIGFTPNLITTLSLIFGLISVFYLHKDNNLLFGVFYLISYFFDCIDGMMARKYKMVSKFGDYYDHAKDIVIFILLMYYLLKRYKFTKNVMLYSILILFYLLSFVHLDCQEKIYAKKDESSTLSFLNGLCNKENAKKTIKLTKYFGLGTATLVFIITPFYLKK